MLIVSKGSFSEVDWIKDDPVYKATFTTTARTACNADDKKDRRFKKEATPERDKIRHL